MNKSKSKTQESHNLIPTMASLLESIDKLIAFTNTTQLHSRQLSKQNSNACSKCTVHRETSSSAVAEYRLDAINSQRIQFKDNQYSKIDVNAPFPKLQNDALLKVAFGQQPHRIPVWLHRQAGRYMKEFRDVRLKYTFFEICKTPELVTEVTLQPINAFDLDASIIFSDILVIPPILGLNVSMIKGVGPVFKKALRINDDSEEQMLNNLSADQIRSKLSYVYDGIKMTRHALKGKVPLIGFVGGPFTLFAYSVEGKSSKNWSAAKKALYAHPNKCKQIMSTYTDATIAHLVGQAKAGVQALEIFESCSGALSPHIFREFVMPFLKRIYSEVRKQINAEIPMILFAREANVTMDELMECGYEIYAIGWGKDVIAARKESGDKITLQGNLDPWCLYGDDEGIKRNIYRMLNEFDVVKNEKKRLIVNLGHGMMPGMRPSAVTKLIQSVRDFEKENCI